MRKNEKKSIFSLGPNGPILQFFLVVQYLVGSLKIPSDGSNNLIFLDQVKKHCAIGVKIMNELGRLITSVDVFTEFALGGSEPR